MATFAPSLAHAVIVRSDPPAGATLARAPAQVRLWFSEPVAPEFSQVRVLDARGATVPGVQAQVDPRDATLLVVTLPRLGSGVYSLVATALSAADGHAGQQYLSFTIGQAGSRGPGPAANDGWPAAVETLLRWLYLGALVGLTGGLAAALFVLRPAAQPALDTGLAQMLVAVRRRALLCAAWCSLAGLAAGSGLLAWQAGLISRGGAGPLMALLPRLAAGTTAGRLWLVRSLLLALAACLLFALARRAARAEETLGGARALWLPAGLAVIVSGTQAFASHAAALPSAGLPAILADWLHLLAAGVWAGGLLALIAGLLPIAWRLRRSPDLAALLRAAWRPFGLPAALSLGLLAFTGLYGLGRQVASLDALLTTFYGRALLAKSALVLAAAACGLLNAWLLHPGLAARLRLPAAWLPLSPRRLPQVLAAEAGLAMLVLLATGVITSAVPATGPQFAPQPAGTETLGEHAADLLLIFHANPNRAGTNTFVVDVLGQAGPPAGILRVIMRFTYLGQDLGTTSVDAQPVAAGKYQVTGPQVSVAGPWQADVVVRRRGLEDAVAHFRWTAAPPGRPVLISDRPLAPVLTAAAIALAAAAALAAALLWLRHRPFAARRQPGEAAAEYERLPHL